MRRIMFTVVGFAALALGFAAPVSACDTEIGTVVDTGADTFLDLYK